MGKFGISKERLEGMTYDDKTNELTIRWCTGGEEKAVCGLILKVELVDKIISSYKRPYIPYNPDYNEAF
jgi:hypothetical protein